MSIIMKVFLLLAVMICVSEAQHKSNHCLCQSVRNGVNRKFEVKDIQIYPATIFCQKVEIVVTVNRGFRYCLNPNLKAVQKLMTSIIKPKISTTATPTEFTSTHYSLSTSSPRQRHLQ